MVSRSHKVICCAIHPRDSHPQIRLSCMQWQLLNGHGGNDQDPAEGADCGYM